MASSIPTVIAWLVTNIPVAVTAVNSKAMVFDGFPDADADDIVLIGLHDEDGDTRGLRDPASLDAEGEKDTFTIPMYVRSYRGGTDQAGARTAAFQLFDAISKAVDDSPTLGGVLDARISDFDFRQTGTKADAGGGRTARIYFSVTVEDFT